MNYPNIAKLSKYIEFFQRISLLSTPMAGINEIESLHPNGLMKSVNFINSCTNLYELLDFYQEEPLEQFKVHLESSDNNYSEELGKTVNTHSEILETAKSKQTYDNLNSLITLLTLAVTLFFSLMSMNSDQTTEQLLNTTNSNLESILENQEQLINVLNEINTTLQSTLEPKSSTMNK